MELDTIAPMDLSKLKSWEDFVSAGMIARELKDTSQWFLGELALGIETRYGENTLDSYAREIGINPRSLVEYRRVASRYPREKRVRFLSFSHHQRALKSGDPQEVLKLASDNEWSIRQLDRYMVEERSPDCKHEFEEWKICKLCGKKAINIPS